MAVTTSWTLDSKSSAETEVYNIYNWSDIDDVPSTQEWFDLAGKQFQLQNNTDSAITIRGRLRKTPEGSARTVIIPANDTHYGLFIQIRASVDGANLPAGLKYAI